MEQTDAVHAEYAAWRQEVSWARVIQPRVMVLLSRALNLLHWG